jgi:hypothetical protein
VTDRAWDPNDVPPERPCRLALTHWRTPNELWFVAVCENCGLAATSCLDGGSAIRKLSDGHAERNATLEAAFRAWERRQAEREAAIRAVMPSRAKLLFDCRDALRQAKFARCQGRHAYWERLMRQAREAWYQLAHGQYHTFPPFRLGDVDM